MKNVQYNTYLQPNCRNPECYRKSGSGKMKVISDLKLEVELQQFCACAVKSMLYPLFTAELPKFPHLTGNCGRGARW